MTKIELANSLHDQGYSCSQSVLTAFADELGLDKEMALKVSSTFGGGMGRSGDTCGAVTGAVMAIGMKFGSSETVDAEEKTELYNKVKAFLKEFESKNSSIKCRELLGYDISIPEEFAIVSEKGISGEKCPGFITNAVVLLEEMFNK